jgi:hypothetical protein
MVKCKGVDSNLREEIIDRAVLIFDRQTVLYSMTRAASFAFENARRSVIVVSTMGQPMPGAILPSGYFSQEQIDSSLEYPSSLLSEATSLKVVVPVRS